MKERQQIYTEAINTYGKENQKLIAIEEMSELTKALTKDTRYPDNPKIKDNVAEEIADVQIMLFQLIMMFDCENQVNNYIDLKTERLGGRLQNNAE